MNPLNPLYYAVAWVIMRIHAGLSLVLTPTSGWAWALSIALLVVLMRLVLVPLFIKQMHATRKMAALAPQVQELKKKFKNDKQALNQATMTLYRENGANPLAGCLPLLAQMPLFFALFSVLRAISEWQPGQVPKYGLTTSAVVSAQHADILGASISDKFLFQHPPAPLEARLVILLAVVISIVTTFMTVRQSTKRGMTPSMTPADSPMAQSQKYMAYVVPLFALSGLYWQFGLVLYWVTTNLWTLGQQHVLFRKYPVVALPAAGGAAVAGAPALNASGGPRKPVLPGKKPAGGAAKAGSAGVKPSGVKPPAGGVKPSGGGTKPSGSGPKPSGATPAAGGAANGSGGGLRRLVKGRGAAEPEPEPPAAETKLVRQQPSRQSRSRRTGKR